MAWTKGIKHRRNTKSTLELDPPAEGEIVYAIDTGEWGTRLVNGDIGWSYIFNNDHSTTGNGTGGTGGTQMHRFTNTEATNIVNIPTGMVINETTILIIDGIAQKPSTYKIVDTNNEFSFLLDTALNGREDIIVQNGVPVETYAGDVTIDLSGGITLPTWKGITTETFLPYFRLYNNFVIEMTENLFLENPVVAPTGHFGKFVITGPSNKNVTLTLDTMYATPQLDNSLQIKKGEVVIFDYIMRSPTEILLTRTLTWVDTRNPVTINANPKMIYNSNNLFPTFTDKLVGVDNTKRNEIELSWTFEAFMNDGSTQFYTMNTKVLTKPLSVGQSIIIQPQEANISGANNSQSINKELVIGNTEIKFDNVDKCSFNWGTEFIGKGIEIDSIVDVYFKATLIDVIG